MVNVVGFESFRCEKECEEDCFGEGHLQGKNDFSIFSRDDMSFSLALAVVFSFLLFTLQTGTTPEKGTLVVVNQLEHKVLLVEPDIRRTFASIAVGVSGHEAAVSPDARFIYVPIYGNSGVGKPGTDGNTIDVIDIGKRQVSGSIQVGPVRPHRAEFGPDRMLYVTAEVGNTVKVIDPAKQQVIGEIPTGEPQSHMLVISPDGHRAYTANVGPGNISVLDIPARRLITIIPVAKTIQRISMSPDGSRLFTHDQNAPRLAVIDLPGREGTQGSDTTASYKVSRWVDLPGVAYASAPTPDGKYLLVASMAKHLLLAIDMATLKIAKTFDLPESPSEILVTPDGATAFISCVSAGKIAVLDLRAWQLREPIVLTAGVDGLAWVPINTGNKAH
jgi:DNA-binding beta-propeller fold protein YncE